VNRPEWLITYFAAAKLGAILVAVNTRYTTEECRHILRTAGASVLVVQDEFRRRRYLDSVRDLCPGIAQADPGIWSLPELPSLREVIVVGAGALRGSRTFQSVLDDGRRIAVTGAAAPAAGTGPDDTFLILFLSCRSPRRSPVRTP
jgi:fatty-acyl-CoA synthase